MAAYVLGHLMQALTNLAVKRLPTRENLALDPTKGTIPTLVRQAALTRVRAFIVRPTDADSSTQTVVDVSDHFVQKEGETATRDIKVRASIGEPTQADLAPQTVFDLCDHYVQQRGETATRDVYVYREGFYRGMAGALLALGLALIVRACAPYTSIKAIGIDHNFEVSELIVLALSCCASAWLFFQRYRRFGKYLVEYAVYSALVINKKGD
jgi:hypothetical protein